MKTQFYITFLVVFIRICFLTSVMTHPVLEPRDDDPGTEACEVTCAGGCFICCLVCEAYLLFPVSITEQF